MILDNVTIIIPEHNRPERLQRLLDYYEGTGARILVPDSSDKVFEGRCNPSTTTYLHFPRMTFLLKIREVLPLIHTPYTLYCADDDFAVPSGIEKVTQFLDSNPDYVVAQGHYLTFIPHAGGDVTFEPRYIRYFHSRVEGEKPLERLRDRRGQYASFLYGVVRSDVFKQMYSHCFDSDGTLRFTNLFLAEDYFCNAVRISGKYATIPCFFSARERIPGSATNTTVPKSVIMTDPAYSSEYNGYVRSLGELLASREPSLSLTEAEEAIRAIDAAPIDTAGIEWKRRVMDFCRRHRLLSPLTKFFDYRYSQKGLKAVKGMPSYPCRELTPEIRAIIAAVRSTRL